MKHIRYALEAFLLGLLMLIFRVMPVDMASAAGGFIGRKIGPLLGATKKARKNLQRAFPDMSSEEHERTLHDMWDNLGRILGEYPHLKYLVTHRTSFTNAQILKKFHDENTPCMCVGAHIGNWEISCSTTTIKLDIPLHYTYRALNNPYANLILKKLRDVDARMAAYPKSRNTMRQMIGALKGGNFMGILHDQKVNEGIPVPFFGGDAMTSPAFVQICQKYNYPFLPIQTIRTQGAHFELRAFDPIPVFDSEGAPRPVKDVLTDFHVQLESWITENPAQWLWIHRRWDSAALQA